MSRRQQNQIHYRLSFSVFLFLAPATRNHHSIRGGNYNSDCSFWFSRVIQLFSDQFLFVKRDPKCSSSFKEQSPHVASVKSILESHASYLMSGKELSKLVAFVKGTQFDIVVRIQFVPFTFSCLEPIRYIYWFTNNTKIPGFSSTRKIWLCAAAEFCCRAWTDWAKG